MKTARRWDSFAIVSFIVFTTSQYGVTLKPDRVTSCETVDDLGTAIEEQQKSEGGQSGLQDDGIFA